MTGKQYRDTTKKLGMNLSEAGRFLGVSPRSAAKYAKEGPPEIAAKLLRLMLRLGLRPEDVR
jgi:transcriptional regulator with XRE-family HTH domain